VRLAFCVGICTSAKGGEFRLIACNLKAIDAADRPRYQDLMKRLRAAVQARREISGGFAFTLNGKALDLLQVAEWISMERRCCPFLMFQLSVSGDKADWHLKLTGPEGVKSLLEAEFPAR